MLTDKEKSERRIAVEMVNAAVKCGMFRRPSTCSKCGLADAYKMLREEGAH